MFSWFKRKWELNHKIKLLELELSYALSDVAWYKDKIKFLEEKNKKLECKLTQIQKNATKHTIKDAIKRR